MKNEEYTIQKNFFHYASLVMRIDSLTNPYRYMFHIPNGRKRSVLEGVMLKRMGTKPGIPDCLCILPFGKYNGLAFEFKSGKGRLSEHQKEWRVKFIQCGYDYKIFTSSREAIDYIDKSYKFNSPI